MDLTNLKVVNYCWTCNKEHDASTTPYNFNAIDKSVMCGCGGYIVTPSGKTLGGIIPIRPVFKVDDGESHYFAAETVDQVKEYYHELYGETLEDDTEITLVSNEKLRERFITCEEKPHKKLNLIEAINEMTNFPALLCSSVW